MNDFDDVQRLIRLKRNERPPDGYFDRFVDEFHERQRSELLRQSARGLFYERVGTWLSGFGKPRLLVGAGLSYAVAMLVVFFVIRDPRPDGGNALAGQGAPGNASRVSSLLLPQPPLEGGVAEPFDQGIIDLPRGRAPWYHPVSIDPIVVEVEDGKRIIEF